MNTSTIGWWTLFWAIVAGASPPAANIEVPSPPPDGGEFSLPLEDATAAQINRLIPLLGSPYYDDRCEATARLIEIGPPALGKLRAAYQSADDLETRLRIEAIALRAYLSYHVYDRNGFLGIEQYAAPLTHADDPRILEGHVGIRISRVFSDTAAKRAGLRESDVVIARDGQPIERLPNRQETSREFGESVRQKPPGTKMTLTVLRKDQTLDVEVVVGRRDRERYYKRVDSVTGEPEDAAHDFADAVRNYDRWWHRNFRKKADSAPDSNPNADE